MGVIKDQFGATITLGKQLGRGGEGSVHEVLGEPRSVAKLFYDEKLAYYEPRLVEMIPNPPRDQTRSMTPPHISIAWPERILRENKKFIGYIMPRIQMAPDIYKVYSPRIRRAEFPNFDWRYLHHTALNLAIAVHAYHAAGYVIGDLNSKNVLVNRDAMVTMVDADSIQVKTSTGKVMRCPVGTPDFTPPELQGIKLDSVDRTEYHDAFALAVMIFLLVMEGTHPFSGAPKDPSTSVAGPVYQYCIKNGIFPYRPNRLFKPPAGALEFPALNPELQKLFLRCFVDGFKDPLKRPLPLEWIKALQKAETQMKQCKADGEHWYSSHLRSCPWCKRGKSIVVRSVARPKITTARATARPVLQTPANISQAASKPRAAVAPVRPAQPARKFPWWTLIFIIPAGLFLSIQGGIALGHKINEAITGESGVEAVSAEVQATAVPEWLADVDVEALPAVSASCAGAPDLTLQPGDHTRVATTLSLMARSSPEFLDNVTASYKNGDELDILYGPVCVKASGDISYWFWLVEDSAGRQNWVAEGDARLYYLRKAE
jgi:DNA-binding helix-hairpin-helix protein with protein kinase domain